MRAPHRDLARGPPARAGHAPARHGARGPGHGPWGPAPDHRIGGRAVPRRGRPPRGRGRRGRREPRPPQSRGDVAQSIVAHAADLDADLVILATHGAGGAKRVLFGSVPQQVLRKGVRPVLLIRPPEGQASREAAPTDVRRLLVPLDGQPPAEAALPIASVLAQAYAAELVLMHIVPTLTTIPGERASAARLAPSATAASLDLEEAEGRAYIQQMASGLRERGLRVSTWVGRGEPAQSLLEGAAHAAVEMIVMATHGRTGLDAVFSGSVASRIVARFTRPILLVRAPRAQQTASP